MKKPASYNGTQAVTRAIQLLKLFDDDHPEWDLQALTDASGLNKSTTFRILTALESEGLIVRSESGYRLGSDMIVLGGRAMRSNNLRRVSRAELEHLSQTTGENTTLEVLHLDENEQFCSLVIDEVLGKHLVGITQYIGSRLPVHATSTGKVLLAFQSVDTQKRALKQKRRIYTEKTLKKSSAVMKELESIRTLGYALAKGELENGLMTVAAPVVDVNGSVQAAVSIVAPSIRVGEAQLDVLADEAVKTAAKISGHLGWRDDV